MEPVKVAKMKELTRSNDQVQLSWITAELKARGIPCHVLDQHTSVLDGSVIAIQRRVMVDDDDLDEAKKVLAQAERIAQGDDDGGFA